MKEERTKLFGEFTPTTPQEWKEKIVEDLKGVDYDKKMIWRTSEGFSVNPFYTKADIEGVSLNAPGEYPYTRGNKNNNNWNIRQDISTDDVEAANAKARKALSEGVT